MKKNILLLLIVFLMPFCIHAQNTGQQVKSHKIIFQLSSDDTLVHKSLVRQLHNLLNAAPGSMIEVVCLGPGLNFLVTAKTVVQDKIRELKDRSVLFLACENTMRERNIPRDRIIPEAGFIPSGLIEIITKQEEGWVYIKGGF